MKELTTRQIAADLIDRLYKARTSPPPTELAGWLDAESNWAQLKQDYVELRRRHAYRTSGKMVAFEYAHPINWEKGLMEAVRLSIVMDTDRMNKLHELEDCPF